MVVELELEAQVAAMRAQVSALLGRDLEDVDAARASVVFSEVRAAADQLGAVAARLLARVEADGRWAAGGSRTFPEWVARREGVSVGAARRQVALGRALDEDLPVAATAVAAGQITLEHAQLLARYGPTTQARRAALGSGSADRNEAFLVDKARELGADEFAKELRRWAIRTDATAAEREHEVAATKEHLNLSPRHDGVAVQGFLTTEHATVVLTALRAVTGVPATGDDRSTEQRHGAALVDLARLVLDTGLAGGGSQVRPHLSVHVSWETLQRLNREHPAPAGVVSGGAGEPSSPEALARLAEAEELEEPAELDAGEPIPASLLARIACDSEIARIVFGPEGQVLDVGRARRTYNGHLRRAVTARDRQCRFPGCTAPPMLGEVHHILPWSRLKQTAVKGGILLCWYHHDLVHRRGIQITGTEGRWTFRHHNGALIDPGRRRSQAPPDAEPPEGAEDAPPAEPPPDAEPPTDAEPSPGADRELRRPPTQRTQPARRTSPTPVNAGTRGEPGQALF